MADVILVRSDERGAPLAHPVLLMLLVVCVAAASSLTTLAILVSVQVS